MFSLYDRPYLALEFFHLEDTSDTAYLNASAPIPSSLWKQCEGHVLGMYFRSRREAANLIWQIMCKTYLGRLWMVVRPIVPRTCSNSYKHDFRRRDD